MKNSSYDNFIYKILVMMMVYNKKFGLSFTNIPIRRVNNKEKNLQKVKFCLNFQRALLRVPVDQSVIENSSFFVLIPALTQYQIYSWISKLVINPMWQSQDLNHKHFQKEVFKKRKFLKLCKKTRV